MTVAFNYLNFAINVESDIISIKVAYIALNFFKNKIHVFFQSQCRFKNNDDIFNNRTYHFDIYLCFFQKDSDECIFVFNIE